MKRNQGAVLLARTGLAQEVVAAVVGKSRVTVSNWMNARKRPDEASRAVLAERYGIPVTAWDEEPPKRAPKASPVSPLAPVAPSSPILAHGAGHGATVPDQVLSMADELMGDLRQGLDELRKDSDALPLEKARVRASLGQTLAILGKMTGAFDLGARFFKLPLWREVEQALARGLAGHPEAAAAVAAELRRVEMESGYKRT